MNIVLIVPTGIGCEIGGHAGDAQPIAKLIGACCDNLITHPNVVNASDINEMPENTWYVEGSQLDQFLEGKIYLKPVYQNKVLIVVNKADWQSINAVNAARASIGSNAEILELETPLELIAKIENGIATGEVKGWLELVEQVENYNFDALGIVTPITISEKILKDYFIYGGVNPVGGVEAIASKLIANYIKKPVAHGPVDYGIKNFKEIVDPRKSVEIITENFVHCILKGLNKAPKIVMKKNNNCLGAEDVDLMISPWRCWGPPHKACLEKEIPIMIVKENKSVLNDTYPLENDLIFVDNYIEAAGYLMVMKAGIHPSTVRRPLKQTKILKNNINLTSTFKTSNWTGKR